MQQGRNSRHDSFLYSFLTPETRKRNNNHVSNLFPTVLQIWFNPLIKKLMVLLIDIGNSTIVAATASDNGEILNTWRFKTLKDETVSYYRTEILSGMKKYQISTGEILKVVVSSVVPEVNDDISMAITDIFGKSPRFFTLSDAEKCMAIDVESPSQLGKDRLADAIGAAASYGVPVIVFDMGTATTVGIVDDHNTFLGGMIIPGVKTSLTALSSRASQLPVISIEKPKNMVGRNTLECMQSGILYGTAAMVDGIIDRLSASFGKEFKVVATGGMAKTIVPHCQHTIVLDNFLQFKGLFQAMAKN